MGYVIEKDTFLDFSTAHTVFTCTCSQKGWIRLQARTDDFELYYFPLSIQKLQDGKSQVSTLMNYKDRNGNLMSIVTARMFDSSRKLNQDLSHVQYDQHWGDGEVMNTSGKEMDWKEVPPETNGNALLALTCGDTPGTSIQLHR